jgi:hypothetical protein
MVFQVRSNHDADRFFPRGNHAVNFAFDSSIERVVFGRVVTFAGDRLWFIRVVVYLIMQVVMVIVVIIVACARSAGFTIG